MKNGGIELELYDFSPQAESSMGNDVAWLYRIEKAHKPRLRELLAERTGRAVGDDESVLEAFAKAFEHVHAIRDWLREKGIPYEEKFDSWA